MSTSRRHWVACSCFNLAQHRIASFEGKRYTKTYRWTKAYKKYVDEFNSGIYIDGGTEYQRVGGNMAHFEDLSKYKYIKILKPKKSKVGVSSNEKR